MYMCLDSAQSCEMTVYVDTTDKRQVHVGFAGQSILLKFIDLKSINNTISTFTDNFQFFSRTLSQLYFG